MSDYVIPPYAPSSLAIKDESSRFPIRRVFCVGRNYWWDAGQDAQNTARELPFFFMKPPDAVVPAEGCIAYPPLTADFCHEIELVVAIGKDGADIAPEDALSHVWGYAAGLDLTRRELQAEAKKAGRPWEGAKAFDASAPCSALVPVAAIGHPEQGAIWLNVNDVERQRSNLSDFIWPVKDVISFISSSVKLRAGDLIFTGTPTGVAALEPGDVITAGIDGINQFTVTIGERKNVSLVDVA
ncbi:fumarylacetoacetate hydrolase family protein [Glaciimonas sp. PAMC28666]|uniref:fumarylacetoacetate hydrolase family protein n=1 Tax=Glaciimonas sp. PAMC28666 TaxID=2807626 RepID=UPI0019627855|nr:fumarylacetoacetate hydrolase family protein [Glaciimonas sp. PAMC28666]QRX82462.1 fumarylacetoacetate hydrolase family protein [Glaciimonas sp. PAMC28666]